MPHVIVQPFAACRVVAAEQLAGMREVDDDSWIVTFLDHDLEFFEKKEGRVESGPDLFTPETVSAISPE